MAQDHRSELTQVTIHAAGVRYMMFMGGERGLVVGGLFVAMYLGFITTMRAGMWFGVPTGAVLWGIWIALMREMALRDPLMSRVVRRSMRYRAFYPARGRIHAPSPSYRDFK
jgi:type IV secretory pathway TrbD component